MPTISFRLLREVAAVFIVALGHFCAAAHALSAEDAKSLGEPKTPRKPNIVFIFADDLGWQEPGFAGSDFNETPNLDRLAKQGMIFTQSYSAAGNCAPSRGCLLSGQYTPRHEVYAVGSTDRGPRDLMRLVAIKNKSGLAADNYTLPKAMKSAGYATGMFGKWHLTGPEGSEPEDHFDVVKVGGHGWSKNVEGDPKAIFAITTAACDFMEANKERPFFAYVSHYAIHTPHQSRKDVFEKFKQKTPGKLHKNVDNAACLAELDAGVGLVMQKIADLGLEENTLVVFTSDNGGPTESQEPLRGAKGGYYEGGIREPTVARWPAVIKPGTTCDVPVIHVDYYATFAALGGAKLPADRPLDGTNLLPLFEGRNALDRTSIYWHFPGYLDSPVLRGRDPVFRTRPVSVVRKGDWKLHLYHEEWQLDGGREKLATNNAVELYNVVSDPGEHENVATKETAKRDELVDDLIAWGKRTDAKFANDPNPDYNPDAKPPVKKSGKGKPGKGKKAGK